MPGGRSCRSCQALHAPCSHGPSTIGLLEPKAHERARRCHPRVQEHYHQPEVDPPQPSSKSRLPSRSRRLAPPDRVGVAPVAAACRGAAATGVVLLPAAARRVDAQRSASRPASRREIQAPARWRGPVATLPRGRTRRPRRRLRRPGFARPRPLAAAREDEGVWEGPAAGGVRVSSPLPRGATGRSRQVFSKYNTSS
jgi:hypothetical protein